jgi:hypothetical protein
LKREASIKISIPKEIVELQTTSIQTIIDVPHILSLNRIIRDDTSSLSASFESTENPINLEENIAHESIPSSSLQPSSCNLVSFI